MDSRGCKLPAEGNHYVEEDHLASTGYIIKLTRDKGPKKYNILRIRGPNTTRIRNVYVILIQV
jgi:hypothetical protein